MKLITSNGGFLLEQQSDIGSESPLKLLLLAQIDRSRLTESELATVMEFVQHMDANPEATINMSEEDQTMFAELALNMEDLSESSDLQEGVIRHAVGSLVDALSFKDIRVYFKAGNFKKVSAEIKNVINKVDKDYKAAALTSFYHNVSHPAYGIGDFRSYATPERSKAAVKWFDEHKNEDTAGNLISIFGRHFGKLVFQDRVDVRTRADLLKTHEHLDAVVNKIMSTVKNKEFEAYARRVCQSIYTSWYSYVRSFARFAK